MNHVGRYELTRDANKDKVATFGGVEDVVAFIRDVKQGVVKYAYKGNAKYMKQREQQTDAQASSKSWCEGMTSDQCVAAMLVPTAVKCAAMERFTERLAFNVPLAIQPRRKNVKRLDDGDVIDAERFASGTIEGIWSRRQRIGVMRPTIRVGINVAANCHVASDDMARSAASVLALVKQCEDSGYAITLDWVQSASSHGTITFVVPLKSVGGTCDWSTLVGMCVGASTFRTLGFDLISAMTEGDHGSSYGSSVQVSTGYDIIAPSAMRTDSEAQAWVEKALLTVGGGA